MTKQVNYRWVLTLTSLGFFMSMMDAMIVTTASTAIRSEFEISVGTLQWALNAYNITIAAILLVGVALGERLGRRRIYQWGILIFTIGSALCALAPNISLLIGARIIAGVGASVMTPMSMAILTNAVPGSQRGRALGIWSGIGGLALIVGPSLGGFIVAKIAWQWIFWINVPVGIAGIGLAQRYLPESRGAQEPIRFGDASLIVIAMAGLIWTLSATTGGTLATDWWPILLIGLISVGCGLWFIRRQTVETAPLMPVRFFKIRAFTGGNIATALLYASMYGVVFFLPQYLQVSQRATALSAGLGLLPWTGTLVIVAPFAGQAVDRFGEKRVATWGLFLQGTGYGAIAWFVHWQRPYIWLVIPLGLAGVGLSMAGPALQKAVLGAVNRTAIGKAAGVYNVFRLFGGAIGTTVAVIIFYSWGGNTASGAFGRGFQAVMLGAGFISWLGLLWSSQLGVPVSRMPDKPSADPSSVK
ncbi:MFS transporter [Levilactobacillus cerevisiae]|uniref:MFS transporter n=1 Tax=Levilactobacillus cerevisiae TaxID=1704076 RepID=UPI00345EE141